ncbi:MAG TPA: AAA family ATPase [Chitinophagales bacterium]|nr:AAA family ATPase [Chitinophagales bacterium]HNL06843.1 AAA family ATPase [Chitinophagales bacterium]
MPELRPITTSFGNNDELSYGISLERLTLTNFRCFDSLEINFDSRLTVFIAENGGGKTTVLDAIAECLKNYLAALKVNGYENKLLPDNSRDIKIGEQYVNCSLWADIDYVSLEYGDDLLEQDEDDDDNGPKYSFIEIANNSIIPLIFTTAKDEQKQQLASEFYQQAEPLKKYTHLDFPVLAYYGGDSVVVEYHHKEETHLDKLNMVYAGALSSSRFSFTTFYNWWKHNEDIMLRSDQTSPKFRTLKDQFAKLSNAIEFLLNDDIDNRIYSGLRINEELEMGMKKKTSEGDKFIAINQFSAGEKALFAFIADLGLRLLHATPLSLNADADHAYRILGKGIVLIDEVDLHLHPKWQQKVIGKLMDIFPDVQFVVSTHSAAILPEIPSKHILRFSENKAFGVEYTQGQDYNTILQNMGLDIANYEIIVKVYESLVANEITTAEQLLSELREKTEGMSSELAQLETLLELKKGE